MIRMGRGNRPEPATGGDTHEAPKPAAYAYSSEPQPASGRAISESDSMARDIKEGRLSGFVGHGTTLTGETEFHAMLRVDGHMVGRVASESGTLIVGTTGQVDANIAVAAAMINGTVHGDIVASEKLQLGRTARIIGNIQSPRLIVEEGAILEGTCSMLIARETQEQADEPSTVEAAPEPELLPQASLYSSAAADDNVHDVMLEDDDDDDAIRATA
jgi:cytoskeletal protein CcmA (bactofilin family)